MLMLYTWWKCFFVKTQYDDVSVQATTRIEETIQHTYNQLILAGTLKKKACSRSKMCPALLN